MIKDLFYFVSQLPKVVQIDTSSDRHFQDQDVFRLIHCNIIYDHFI